MKQLFFLFLFVIGFAFQSAAQPPMYDDLLIYYADGDYEKLVKKAEKYTLDSDTKNDPLPYLYCSKANFEMSKDQKYLEDYPKAFNDAVKFAGKAIKKDKDGAVYGEHTNYFTDLKTAVVEDIRNMVDAEDYYKKHSSKYFISKTQRPTLIVNAMNDPILSPECTPLELAKNHPYLQIELLKEGGHVGFFKKGHRKTLWSEERALKFITQIV